MEGEKSFFLPVPAACDGLRADEALQALLGMSNRQIRTLKRTKGIFLDGAPVYANCVVRAGQVLGAVCESPYDQGIVPQAGPLRVLYADEDLLLVDKPAPMATLPTRGKPLGTLANLVAAYEGRTPFLFRPVNRLDRGTSGIVVAARHALAQKRQIESLHTPAFLREYLAVCEGIVQADGGRICAPIGREAGSGLRRCVRPDGSPSQTEFRVLFRFKETRRTLLSLRLQTGRTHQIRVHLAHIGHPVTGDALYGAPCPLLPDRFALHAWRAALTQPFTGARIDVRAPLPEGFAALAHRRGEGTL